MFVFRQIKVSEIDQIEVEGFVYAAQTVVKSYCVFADDVAHVGVVERLVLVFGSIKYGYGFARWHVQQYNGEAAYQKSGVGPLGVGEYSPVNDSLVVGSVTLQFPV